MHCNKCGNELKKTDSFCNKCGKEIKNKQEQSFLCESAKVGFAISCIIMSFFCIRTIIRCYNYISDEHISYNSSIREVRLVLCVVLLIIYILGFIYTYKHGLYIAINYIKNEINEDGIGIIISVLGIIAVTMIIAFIPVFLLGSAFPNIFNLYMQSKRF